MSDQNAERLAKIHYTEYALRQKRTMPSWQSLAQSERETAIWAMRAVLADIEDYDYRTDPVNQPENIR